MTDFSTCTKVLGSLVRQAREDAHLTQAEAGKIAGLSQRTILDIEQGRGNPKLDVLVALTTGLGIDPALLFGITREDSPEKERLLLEITSCTENEARCLYEVCHSMLGRCANYRSRGNGLSQATGAAVTRLALGLAWKSCLF